MKKPARKCPTCGCVCANCTRQIPSWIPSDPKVPLARVIAHLMSVAPRAVGTAELAERFSMDRHDASNRLRRLVRMGKAEIAGREGAALLYRWRSR